MRSTGRSTAHRAFLMSARAMCNIANDSTMSQQGDHDAHSGESHKGAERLQNYGMTAVPLPPNAGGGGSGGEGSATGSGGGAGQGGGDPRSDPGWGPEAHIQYGSGNKSHPTVTHIEDRRHRPRELKPGESFQYDDQGQGTYIKRSGSYHMAVGDENQSSMRHVVKEKQPFPWQSSGGSGGAGSASGGGGGNSAQAAKDYKHEGQSVTSEYATEKNSAFGEAQDTIQHLVSKQRVQIDKEHVAINSMEDTNVVWTDKEGNWCTKPLQVKGYPYKKKSRSAKDASGGGSGGGGGGGGGSGSTTH